MTVLKDADFNGIKLCVLKDGIKKSGKQKGLVLELRIFNTSDMPNKTSLKLSYRSDNYGYFPAINMNPLVRKETIFEPHSYVDTTILFDEIKKVHNGDRIIIELSHIVSMSLIRVNEEWYVLESEIMQNDYSNQNKYLENQIEHFDLIEDKCGISLQDFNISILDNESFDITFDVIAKRKKVDVRKIMFNAAVYDKDNNIISLHSCFNGQYLPESPLIGSKPLCLEIREFAFPFSEIGKIRVFLS